MVYKEITAEGKSVINDRCSHLPSKFSVNESHDKIPTMFWSP